MKKLMCMILLASGGWLMAQNKTLVTVHGERIQYDVQMDIATRNGLSIVTEGTMIFNTDTKCQEFWDGTGWYNYCWGGYTDPALALSITGEPGAPNIVCSGSGMQTMTVTANGTGLTYSWRKNGTPVVNGSVISGQGTATLTLNNPDTADAGSYDVIVGDGTTTVTSAAVTAQVTALPTVSASNASGIGSANLVATPSAGATVKWYDVATGGASLHTGTSYTVSTSGTYYAEATVNTCASATRTAVTATVTPFTINTQPTAPGIVCSGTGAQTMTVAAAGATTYQWRKGGTPVVNGSVISGQGTATLILSNPTAADAGNYDVEVSNGTTTVTSAAVTAQVTALPTVSASPVTVTGIGSVNLVATPSAGAIVTWYDVATGGVPSHTGTSYTVSTSGTYYAEATVNTCASATRTAVTATVTPFTINTQPTAPAIVCSGTGAQTMTVAAAGATTYQWRKEGNNLSNGGVISGATTATLILTNPTAADAGNYDVEVSNGTTTLTSTVVTASTALPTITGTTPDSRTGTGTVVLGATASAGATINWYAAATGATVLGTGTSFTTPSIAATTTYYAEATINGCASARIAVTATIIIIPQWLTLTTWGTGNGLLGVQRPASTPNSAITVRGGSSQLVEFGLSLVQSVEWNISLPASWNSNTNRYFRISVDGVWYRANIANGVTSVNGQVLPLTFLPE